MPQTPCPKHADHYSAGEDWPERSQQIRKALGYLAFHTGPKNGSNVSRLMARAVLVGMERILPRAPGLVAGHPVWRRAAWPF
jgi:hypothetical protein